MANFFKSLFGGKAEEDQQKNDQKNFEILKYDGLRALRMGNATYAATCFIEALQLEEDFETMKYLSDLYIQTHQMEKAHEILNRMIHVEPTFLDTYLTLAHVCFMQSEYAAMEAAAQKATEIAPDNAMAFYLWGKSMHEQKNDIMAIGHLTKAIMFNHAYVDALLLRAEILLNMHQLTEAATDINHILDEEPEDEAALLLNGRLKEAEDKTEEAEAAYRKVIALNPFNEQAFLQLGLLFIHLNKATEAIELLDEAIELNPNFVKAYQERGRAKLMIDDKEGSIADVQKALELQPKDGESLNGVFNNQQSEGPKDIWQI